MPFTPSGTRTPFRGGLDPQDPASRWFPITPSDTVDLAEIPKEIYVGGAGNITALGFDGVSGTFAVTAGQILRIRPARVMAAGTSATGLVGLASG